MNHYQFPARLENSRLEARLDVAPVALSRPSHNKQVMVNRKKYTAQEVLEDAITKWQLAATGKKCDYDAFNMHLIAKYKRSCALCGVFNCECCVYCCNRHGHSGYEIYVSILSRHQFRSKIARDAAAKVLEELKKITVEQIQERMNVPL